MFDAVGRPGRVLLLGGTSGIGLAIVRALQVAPDGRVILAGRDPTALAKAGSGLDRVVEVEPYDAHEPKAHAELVDRVFGAGDVDVVIAAAGVLGDQEAALRDPGRAVDLLETNVVGQVSVLLPVAARMRQQGHGVIVVLSSIAAIRPRRANVVYAASKAAIDAFARGLGYALAGSGVSVVVVRPGFVFTRMTVELPPAPFATTAANVGRVAAEAVRAANARGTGGVVYAPARLRAVAPVLAMVPTRIWRKVQR